MGSGRPPESIGGFYCSLYRFKHPEGEEKTNYKKKLGVNGPICLGKEKAVGWEWGDGGKNVGVVVGVWAQCGAEKRWWRVQFRTGGGRKIQECRLDGKKGLSLDDWRGECGSPPKKKEQDQKKQKTQDPRVGGELITESLMIESDGWQSMESFKHTTRVKCRRLGETNDVKRRRGGKRGGYGSARA